MHTSPPDPLRLAPASFPAARKLLELAVQAVRRLRDLLQHQDGTPGVDLPRCTQDWQSPESGNPPYQSPLTPAGYGRSSPRGVRANRFPCACQRSKKRLRPASRGRIPSGALQHRPVNPHQARDRRLLPEQKRQVMSLNPNQWLPSAPEDSPGPGGREFAHCRSHLEHTRWPRYPDPRPGLVSSAARRSSVPGQVAPVDRSGRDGNTGSKPSFAQRLLACFETAPNPLTPAGAAIPTAGSRCQSARAFLQRPARVTSQGKAHV